MNIKSIKNSNHRYESREELRPYKGKRLRFEGVPIHRDKPNKHNKFKHGYVFTSLYSQNENIELDHTVIEMLQKDYNASNIKLYHRYSFSAQVDSYFKFVNLKGIMIKKEFFMLRDININTMYIQKESKLKQPTNYIKTRINQILNKPNMKKKVNYRQIIKKINNLPNNGSIEKYISQLVKQSSVRKSNKLNRKDIAIKFRTHKKDKIKTLDNRTY